MSVKKVLPKGRRYTEQQREQAVRLVQLAREEGRELELELDDGYVSRVLQVLSAERLVDRSSRRAGARRDLHRRSRACRESRPPTARDNRGQRDPRSAVRPDRLRAGRAGR